MNSIFEIPGGFLVPNLFCFILIYLFFGEKLGYQKTSGRVQMINLKKVSSNHEYLNQ